ncbi:MAG: hypothetical protein ACRDSL_24100 [Pseudonocardiaceae bacterium]
MNLTEQQYQETIEYLDHYVHNDWLGFSVLVGSAGELLGPRADEESYQDLVLRMVDDLLSCGAVAGDLTDKDEEPFQPWPLDRPATLARIRNEMAALGRLPDSGDIGWLTVP